MRRETDAGVSRVPIHSAHARTRTPVSETEWQFQGLPDPLPAVGRGTGVLKPSQRALESVSGDRIGPPTSVGFRFASRRQRNRFPHGVAPHRFSVRLTALQANRFASRRHDGTRSLHGRNPTGSLSCASRRLNPTGCPKRGLGLRVPQDRFAERRHPFTQEARLPKDVLRTAA